MKLSRFFQVPIDYILGGDFTRWDTNGGGSGMSVSESKATYTTYGSLNPQTAFNRIEFDGLTHGEIDLLAEYAEFIKSRRKKE